MNEVTIPYHLLIPSLLSLLVLIIIITKRKQLFTTKEKKLLWISLSVFFILYLFTVGSATFDEMYLQWKLNQFDLNKDGFFSGKEITKDQQAIMFQLTDDVGRNLSFITGFIFSLMVALIVYLAGKIMNIKKIKTRLKILILP